MLLHVLSGTVCHILIESSQQNGPDHDGDIKAKAGQETAALQSHVWRSNDQGLSRTVFQREEVITGGHR